MSAITAPPITKSIVVPVTTTGAYATLETVGALLTVNNAPRSGILQSVVLADKDAQSAALDLVLFSANPTASTLTDNAALSVADADALKVIGHVRITAANYMALAASCVATVNNIGLAFALDGSTLYAALMTNGSTPTYATSATALQLTLNFIPDA
jgi:hypothetical protein